MFKWIREEAVVIVGILVSLIIAGVMVFLGQDTVDSVLVGLITTCITLIVEMFSRLTKTEQRILETDKLRTLLRKDDDLREQIYRIVKNYQSIQSKGFEIFQTISSDALLECDNTMNNLVSGYIQVEVAGKYSYGRKSVRNAKEKVRAVAYEDIDTWRTEHLKDVLHENEKAVKRGIKIQRIFILAPEKEAAAYDVLEAHEKSGVEVFVVSPNDVPQKCLLSYSIADHNILVTFFYSRDGKKFTGEEISVNTADISNAEDNFEATIRRAKKFESNSSLTIQSPAPQE